MSDERTTSGGADDLVRFFHGLGDVAQREYRELAEVDRSFGEDVVAERRARQQEGA